MNNVHAVIAESLAKVRQALRLAHDACARADPGSQCRSLFAALLELINQGGTALPGEAAPGGARLASWQSVRSILAGSAVAGSTSSSSAGTYTMPSVTGSANVPQPHLCRQRAQPPR